MSDGRIHKANLEIDQWRGTIGEIVLLLETAQQILADTVDDPELIRSRVDVRYQDGSETFASVDRLADARSRIEVDRIASIQTFMSSDTDHQIWFLLGGFPGLRLSASSADRVWAFGAVDVLTGIAARGEQPRYGGQLRPLRGWEWATLGGGALAIGALVVVAVALALPFTLVAWGVIGVLGTFLIFGGMAFDSLRVLNPAVSLLPDGAQLPSPDSHRISLSKKVQDSVSKRPLLSLGLTFLFGIAVNKASDWI